MAKKIFLLFILILSYPYSGICNANNIISFLLFSQKETTDAVEWVEHKAIAQNHYVVTQDQYFAFNIKTTEKGYVSLWYKDKKGNLISFLKNRPTYYFSINQDTPIKIGIHSDGYKFNITEAEITEHYYALWTKEEKQQPDSNSTLSVKQLKQATVDSEIAEMIIDVSPKPFETYRDTNNDTCKAKIFSSKLLSKRITYKKGDVYLLAMGANTDGLQKAHSDACYFAGSMKVLFNISKDHLRLRSKAKRNDFINGLNWLAKNANKDDLVIIYFSGHGSTREQTQGEEDIDEVYVMRDLLEHLSDDSKMIVRDNEFYAATKKIKTDNIISIVDACYSAGSAREERDNNTKYRKGLFEKRLISSKFGKYPASVRQCNSLTGNGIMLAAAQENKVALEDPKKGGIFTLALLSALANATSGESLFDIFNHANSKDTFCLVGKKNILSNLKFD